MPELPEVESIKLGLQKYVAGLTVEKIEIFRPKLFYGDEKLIEGGKIVSVQRIGKGLIINLDNGFSLAIHIKMTGQLVFRDKKTAKEPLSPKVGTIPNKFTHIIFKLKSQNSKGKSKEEEAVLYYNDIRRFGWMKVFKTSEVLDLPFFKNMGPEPFKNLDFKTFEKIVSGSNTKIKPFIMDQTKIGGIGNIYANDILWDARINPSRIAKGLKKAEIERLFNSIIKVLKKGIENGGASELNFVNILGQEGNYQDHTLVYGKKGQKCKRNDGGIIKKTVLGGRGTFFCPVCQV
jgi:formamidopyrimidine-DNA glycosylase